MKIREYIWGKLKEDMGELLDGEALEEAMETIQDHLDVKVYADPPKPPVEKRVISRERLRKLYPILGMQTPAEIVEALEAIGIEVEPEPESPVVRTINTEQYKASIVAMMRIGQFSRTTATATVDEFLKEFVIKVEPEQKPEPVLPGITPGRLEIEDTGNRIKLIKYEHSGVTQIYQRDYAPVSKWKGLAKKEILANAKLHAAAPDMLEVLYEIRHGDAFTQEMYAKVVAALRKAGIDT